MLKKTLKIVNGWKEQKKKKVKNNSGNGKKCLEFEERKMSSFV